MDFEKRNSFEKLVLSPRVTPTIKTASREIDKLEFCGSGYGRGAIEGR
jgi:hypothetical protein